MPGVITADLRLNEPRYVKLPEILKAKRKPLEVIALASLGIESAPQFTVVHTASPEPRKRGVMVKDVGELVAAMRLRGVI
jgi:electron transfer flavoprotein beta subunit